MLRTAVLAERRRWLATAVEDSAMSVPRELTESIQRLLKCPVCRSDLHRSDNQFVCANNSCTAKFPIVDGVPILINEANSLFMIDDYLSKANKEAPTNPSVIKTLIKRFLPSLSHNLKTSANYAKLVSLLTKQESSARILVVGGRILGKGMEPIAENPGIELIETDIALGPRTSIICDGHDLPFADGSMDAVIIQAVLHCVVNPYRCVDEIYRVLKDDGFVYSETPFMQQVVDGPHDFQRFTLLGHRRLFRRFEEVAAGSGGGPGMVLGWAYEYFLLGFASSKRGKALAMCLAQLTGFWIKYFDYFVVDRIGAQDGTKGTYFLGRKSAYVLPDRELTRRYRGLM